MYGKLGSMSWSILWFQKELRTRDNPLSSWAIKNKSKSLGVIFLPPENLHSYRTFFLYSALELKKKLEAFNIPVLILDEKPNPTLSKISFLIEVDNVVTTENYNSKDKEISQNIKNELSLNFNNKQCPINFVEIEDLTLLKKTALPFSIEQLPFIFTEFKKKVIQYSQFPDPLEYDLNSLKDIQNSHTIHAFHKSPPNNLFLSSQKDYELKIFYREIQLKLNSLKLKVIGLNSDFNSNSYSVSESVLVSSSAFESESGSESQSESVSNFESESDSDSNINFKKRKHFPFDLMSGEDAANKRLHQYFSGTKGLLRYKETRNGLINLNDSSKFSLYLSCGTLSPRQIHSKLREFEVSFGRNESTEWFLMELLWRDYFKFLALKIGNSLFETKGITSKYDYELKDPQYFEKWTNAQTGADFIDANMNELNCTGWMSNRGRQNVASYLTKTLRIDWTLGAQYFENHLIDFDRENNWGNWLYLSGNGTDPRDRVFNYQRQAEMYDSDGQYRKKWLKHERLSK